MPELISPLDMAEEGMVVVEQEGEPVPGESPVDLDAVRQLVLRAHPDVVPELVTGDSVAALIASVDAARSAYERLVASWADRRPVTNATVPAGGGAPIAVDPDRLPAAEKIRRGLSANTQKR